LKFILNLLGNLPIHVFWEDYLKKSYGPVNIHDSKSRCAVMNRSKETTVYEVNCL